MKVDNSGRGVIGIVEFWMFKGIKQITHQDDHFYYSDYPLKCKEIPLIKRHNKYLEYERFLK